MTATAFELGPFWVVDDGKRILCRDGRDNPPLVYAAEMLAVLHGFVSVANVCSFARPREEALIKLRVKAFSCGLGPHPATMGLD